MQVRAPAGAPGRALADRIHDDVLQLLGTAMLKAELCEQLLALGRAAEVPDRLEELHAALGEACAELRGVMAELRRP